MNYKDRWQAVADARKAQRKARKAKRKLRKVSNGARQQRNAWKATRAAEMRACPTKCEALLFDAMKDAGIQFHTQVQIGPYIADALIPGHRTVVEVDGPVHDDRKDYDLARDRMMWNAGYRVIRVTNAEVKNDAKSCVEKIKEFCR